MAAKKGSSKSGKASKTTKKPAKKATKAKAAAVKAGDSVSDSFNELIGRALTDNEFRALLFSNQAKATRGFKLTSVDREALKRLTVDNLESQAERLGNRAAITIKVVIRKKF
jgi:hypothetical protein